MRICWIETKRNKSIPGEKQQQGIKKSQDLGGKGMCRQSLADVQSKEWEMDMGEKKSSKYGWWGLGPDCKTPWMHAEEVRPVFLCGHWEDLYVQAEECHDQKCRMRAEAGTYLLSLHFYQISNYLCFHSKVLVIRALVHLENICSPSCSSFPNFDPFHDTISKNTFINITTNLIGSILILGSCQAPRHRYKFFKNQILLEPFYHWQQVPQLFSLKWQADMLI